LNPLRRIARRARAEDRLAGWHPLLFAAYPVLFLWSTNVEDTPPRDALQVLVWVVLAAIVATFLMALLIGDRARAALIVTPIVFALLMYGHVVDLVKAPTFAYKVGWAALIGLAALLAWRLSSARMIRVDRLLLVLSAVLVGVTLVPIVPHQIEVASAGPPRDAAAGRVLATTTTAQKRDVYLLTFDDYPSDRAIELQFGIKNDLTAWLRDHAFQVLDESHANYISTSLSLSTTVNIRTLDDLTADTTSPSIFRERVYSGLQNSLVAQQFKALGYRYLHIGSWWGPTRFDSAADVNYNYAGGSDFSSVLIEESVIPAALKALGSPEQTFSKNYQAGRYGLDALDRVPDEPGPKFVWAHILLPHPAYVFNSDGTYMSAAMVRRLGEKEAFLRQLEYTNSRLESFLGGLLALPEEQRPIVILQSDEGYVFTRNAAAENEEDGTFNWQKATPEQLEIKFGIQNAWYVPGGVDLGLDPKMTAINTFPILFKRYFGLDYQMLPDRVMVSLAYDHGARLLDVTDRLPSLK
jgi:hypothetical protein